MLFRNNSLKQVFDNLVHQNSVVTFSCESSVRSSEELRKSAARQKAHAATALSTGRGCLQTVPSHECLNTTAEGRDFPAEVVCFESISDKVVVNVEGESARENW